MEETIINVIHDLDNIRDQLGDLCYDLENIEIEEPDKSNCILDLQLFKDKLELYGLRSEELWNFIDDYIRLYNK